MPTSEGHLLLLVINVITGTFFSNYIWIYSITTGHPNTISAVEINVLLFTCVPVSFRVV